VIKGFLIMGAAIFPFLKKGKWADEPNIVSPWYGKPGHQIRNKLR
jgi:hypothetical protein